MRASMVAAVVVAVVVAIIIHRLLLLVILSLRFDLEVISYQVKEVIRL